MDEDVEDRCEGEPAKNDISEDIIQLPERGLNSIGLIASPRLVHPDLVRDFDTEVVKDTSTK